MEIMFEQPIPITERDRRKTELVIYGIYTSGKELYFRTVDEDGGSDISLSELINNETAIEVDPVKALKAERSMKYFEKLAIKKQSLKEIDEINKEIRVLDAQIPEDKI